MKLIFKSLSLLTTKEKILFSLVALVSILAVFLEILGIGILLPIITFFVDPELFKNSKIYFFINDHLFNLANISEKSLIQILIYTAITFFLIRSIFLTLHHYLLIKFIYDLRLNLSTRLYKIYIYQPAIFFYENETSKLTRNLLSEVAEFIHRYIFSLLNLLSAIFIMIGLSTLIAFQSLKIFLFLVILSLIFFSIYWSIIKKRLTRSGKARHNSESTKTKEVLNTISAFKEIKIYRKESFFIKNFKRFWSENLKSISFHLILNRFPVFILEFIFIFFILITILYFIKLDINIVKFVPTIFLFIIATARLLPSILKANENLQNVTFSAIAVEYLINEFSLLSPKMQKNVSNHAGHKNIKSITINNLSYEYKSNLAILENISEEFQSGSIIGIRGESGSGKSTFLNIIAGLLEPTTGYVDYISDSYDKYDKKDTNKIIGYVSQDNFFFDEDISSNISFEEPKYQDKQKIIKIIKLLNLSSKFIDNNGDILDFKIGDSGKLLSDGQKQRVAIGRAIYRNPTVYFFDEATNSLDRENQNFILEMITKLSENSLIFLISHDPEVIKICHKIYEIKNKKLIKLK